MSKMTEEEKATWIKERHTCKMCGKVMTEPFGSLVFCCRSCSNRYVALNQSSESKAIKIAKGSGNLRPHGDVFKSMTSDQIHDRNKKSASTRSKIAKENRREWLNKCLNNEEDPWKFGYSKLKNALIEFGFKDRKCENCGLTEWLGHEIPIEVHHIDGNSKNNSIENLQLLCPNCHALTDNFRCKKIRPN